MARRRNAKSEAELAELRSAGRRRSPLEAIRARCLDCCAGVALEVQQCAVKACANWPYRFGIDPWSATEMPAPATAEPATNEPALPSPKVEVTQAPTVAKRGWRQHTPIHVATVVVDKRVERVNVRANSKSNDRGEDATGSVVEAASKVAAPVTQKRKRGRPRKQMGLFE